MLIESLSDEETQIYLLHFGDGKSLRDIASELHLQVSYVMRVLIRIRDRVHDLLSEPN